MLVDLSSVGRVWAVLGVRPGKELSAELVAQRDGLTAYCPRFKRRLANPVARPLFPGYLFLWLSPVLELAKVRWLPGSRGPLLFQSQLACVEEDLMESWKAREGGRGFSVPDPPAPFRAGDRVRVKGGPFAGLEGTVLESLPARDRVRLLLEHVGRSLSVELDTAALA